MTNKSYDLTVVGLGDILFNLNHILRVREGVPRTITKIVWFG